MMERRAQVKKAVSEGKTKQGSDRSPNLAASVQNPQWATPRAADAAGVDYQYDQGNHSKPRLMLPGQAKAWATPSSSMMAGRSEEMNCRAGREGYGHVGNHLLRQTGNQGKLNPRWVETLMGLPVGWTMPSCASPVTIEPTNSDCSGTESCQPPPQGHLPF